MSKPSSKSPEIVELTSPELEGLFQRLETCNLSDNDKRLFKGLVQSYVWLKNKYEAGKLGLHKLASLLFGDKSEKRSKPGKEESSGNETACEGPCQAITSDVPGKPPSSPKDSPTSASNSHQQGQDQEGEKPKGHGRLGSDAYPHAENITLSHPTLKAGDPCPEGCGGKLYSIDPGVLIRIVGQDIAKAIRYHIQKLRLWVDRQGFPSLGGQ